MQNITTTAELFNAVFSSELARTTPNTNNPTKQLGLSLIGTEAELIESLASTTTVINNETFLEFSLDDTTKQLSATRGTTGTPTQTEYLFEATQL